MSLLLKTDFVSHFQFNAFSGGMQVPNLSGVGSQMIFPARPQDLQTLAELNRAIRRDAEFMPTPTSVRTHGFTKTVLVEGGRRVESEFAYLRADGLRDRMIDPAEPRDLSTSDYITQTTIGYETPPIWRGVPSSVSKSMGGTYKLGKPEECKFEDQWLNLHLTGRLLWEILADMGVEKTDLAGLAACFSLLVYRHGGIQGCDINAFHVLEQPEHDRGGPFTDLAALLDFVRSITPHRGMIRVADGNRRIELTFSEQGREKEEHHVDVRILPGGTDPGIRLKGWLCEIAQSIAALF